MVFGNRSCGARLFSLSLFCLMACSSTAEIDADSLAGRLSTSTEAQSQLSEEENPTPAKALKEIAIPHRYGQTVIPQKPERIITLGPYEEDSLIAIGVTPIAVTEPQGLTGRYPPPWSQEFLRNVQILKLANVDGDIDYGAIAELRPDLVMATKTELTLEQYEELSSIAPTLIQPGPPNSSEMSWQTHAEFIGQVLDLESESGQAILVTQASIFDAIRPHPALEGSTFAHIKVDQREVLQIAGGKSLSSRFFRQLGLAYPSNLDDEIGDADWSLMTEQLESLPSVDVLVVESDPALRDSLIYSHPFLEQENVVWVDRGSGLDTAVSSITILSLSLLLEELVPNISQVVTVVIDPPTAEEEAAMEAFRLVYGSETIWEDTAPHLQKANELRDANELYRLGAVDNDGITLTPKAAEINDDEATIIYDVYFGDSPAYTDLDRTIYLVDGIWQVTKEDFCGFLSAAQTPCPE